jgi:serine protease AprX
VFGVPESHNRNQGHARIEIRRQSDNPFSQNELAMPEDPAFGRPDDCSVGRRLMSNCFQNTYRAVVAFVLSVAMFPSVALAQPQNIDDALAARAKHVGWSRVIVTLSPGAEASAEITKLGGRFGRRLQLINALVIELPNGQIKKLAQHPAVARLDLDRPTKAHMARVANLVGARYVRAAYGYDGAGIGVAVIDSGVTNWHNDLTYTGSNSLVHVQGNQRVAAFVDFVNGGTQPFDDFGHGTHVSGIVAGNGHDSGGSHAGIAPAAHIVSLKVLDGLGQGVISDVIAAIEYSIANRTAYNIRVINLSVGSAVTSSYNVDPLTLAAKRAVEVGMVVVAAAGNAGRNAAGQPQYGAITSPGNAPWVLTVGASSHAGTLNRLDDTHAGYSSRGPTAKDHAAKPDLLAPGTGVVSLSSANSTFYATKTTSLLSGLFPSATQPYLSLSGTSMATPVVAGTVALMLQANPNLTPNLVKAILQYTAQAAPGVDYMTQGGGFLNAKGAVDLARHFATAAPGTPHPANAKWSGAFNWGNFRVTGGFIEPLANAWSTTVAWGASHEADGDNVVWGTADDGDNVVWGTGDEGDNVVWGTTCGGDDCFNVVWGTADNGDNVVWGTADEGGGDNVVWGTSTTSFSSFFLYYLMIFGDVVNELGWQTLFTTAPTYSIAGGGF